MTKGTEVLREITAATLPSEGNVATINGVEYKMDGGILRQLSAMQSKQDELADFYTKHWTLPEAYDDNASDQYQSEIFKVMFGEQFTGIDERVKDGAIVLDIGCGSGVAGRAYFGRVFPRVRYIGVDMSNSIDQAKKEFADKKLPAAFVQAAIESLPFAEKSVDIVFCPGVLHYTSDISASVGHLARHLKDGGTFITWMYKKQKPIRQFTDDLLRAHFSSLSPEAAFEAMKPLTRLGIALGEANTKIVVPEDIPVLGIEAGEYDLQRFFYYHFIKLFYHPELTFTRHNVNNWNAYYPKNVLFPSLDEVQQAFTENGFEIEYLNPQGNGVSVVAHKTARARAAA